MNKTNFIDSIVTDSLSLGVRPGGVLLIHSSLKSLGMVPGGAETVILGLLMALGEGGTLLMPALTYKSVHSNNPVFDLRTTPSCVGIITEIFRLRKGTLRSLHPTHSVCGIGALADELLTSHQQDSTPCGPGSPFHRLPDFDGQILMLGCGLLPNTSMHAIEEIAQVPYALETPMIYTLFDKNGQKIKKAYAPHNFKGWAQRYDRVSQVLEPPDLQIGNILQAQAHLIEAGALRDAALSALLENPFFFVDRINQT